jgi:hypothetical protein
MLQVCVNFLHNPHMIFYYMCKSWEWGRIHGTIQYWQIFPQYPGNPDALLAIKNLDFSLIYWINHKKPVQS